MGFISTKTYLKSFSCVFLLDPSPSPPPPKSHPILSSHQPPSPNQASQDRGWFVSNFPSVAKFWCVSDHINNKEGRWARPNNKKKKMSNINVPAVATGAFLGFLALVAVVSCIPPITRFIGDLLCCPWRIPFTKKKNRNADEEVGRDELPYVVEPRSDTPVDDVGYHNMSEAYMSVCLLP